MEVQRQDKLHFRGVHIKSVHYDSFEAFDFQEGIKMSVDAKLRYSGISADDFSILMKITLNAEKYFLLELEGEGLFEVKMAQNDKEKRQSFINNNAPAIMFPYMRAFISSFTANCGGGLIPTLTIPPQFLSGNLEIVESEK